MTEKTNSELSAVRIRSLQPTKVAFCRAKGVQPEHEAFEILLDWAERKGLLRSSYSYRLYGFDDPCPAKAGDAYAYEVWLTVDDSVEESGRMRIKPFTGGTYAVLQTDLPHIGENWKRLSDWLRSSEYTYGSHQSLEEPLTPLGTPEEEVILDLYMPIKE